VLAEVALMARRLLASLLLPGAVAMLAWFAVPDFAAGWAEGVAALARPGGSHHGKGRQPHPGPGHDPAPPPAGLGFTDGAGCQPSADWPSPRLDRRVRQLLAAMAMRHRIRVSCLRTGHTWNVRGTTRVSNHTVWRAVDIDMVDGRPVSPSNPAARQLALWVGRGGAGVAPSEVGSPWRFGGQRPWFTDTAHQEHIHVGFAGPTRPGCGDIPCGHLALYVQAAGTCPGLAWGVLAGIGKVESDHGRSGAPGVRSGVNRFGCCSGPMQFNTRNGPPSTWDRYGHGGDVYDPRDAVPAAARLLCANGAPRDIRRAVFAYNHAGWYVDQVLSLSGSYMRS
jgi:hypothetical protein